MGALVIVLCSAKGGSGKTAISVALASFVAELNKRVLLVDADAATNGMTLLLLKNVAESKKRRLVGGLFDKEISEPIMIQENLYFIPSSSKMKTTRLVDTDILKKRIDSVVHRFSDKYDLIIFDTEAGTEQSTRFAIDVSSKAVIVTEFDPLSEVGVDRLRHSFEDVWPLGKTYILVNKLLPEFAKIQSDYFKAWSHLTPVHFDFEVMRCYARAEIPWNTEELNQFTKSVTNMSYELLPEYKEDINAWFNQKTEKFKQPAIKEYEEIQLELEESMERLARIRAEMKIGRGVWLTPMERLSYYMAIGTSILLILFGMISLIVLDIDKLGMVLLGIGFGVVAILVGFLSYKRSKQRDKLLLEEERMLLMARELEIQIDRLIQKKYQLESVLASDSKEKFFES